MVHLLTRNLANQEDDFEPEPPAVADGVARHIAFLREHGIIPSRLGTRESLMENLLPLYLRSRPAV